MVTNFQAFRFLIMEPPHAEIKMSGLYLINHRLFTLLQRNRKKQPPTQRVIHLPKIHIETVK